MCFVREVIHEAGRRELVRQGKRQAGMKSCCSIVLVSVGYKVGVPSQPQVASQTYLPRSVAGASFYPLAVPTGYQVTARWCKFSCAFCLDDFVLETALRQKKRHNLLGLKNDCPSELYLSSGWNCLLPLWLNSKLCHRDVTWM